MRNGKHIAKIMALALLLVLALTALLVGCNKNHEWNVVVDKQATCEEDGLQHRTCTVHGETEEPEVIPALGHSFKLKNGSEGPETSADRVWSFDEKNHWHECTRCEERFDETGHSFNDDFECETCGFAQFEYSENSDETYTFVKYNGSSATVEIPATYKGKAVTAIAKNAFKNSKIADIKLPSSLVRIGKDAFFNTASLKAVRVPSLQQWCGIAFETYSSNPLNRDLGAESKTLYVGDAAVEGALDIPDGVESVGEYAFYGYGKINSVTIPSSVTSIGYRAFYLGVAEGDAGITAVNISSLASWSMIEFSSDKVDVGKCYANPLCYGAELKLDGVKVEGALDIPAEATSIGAFAFCGYAPITSVKIPSSVQKIGRNAFEGCSGLVSATVNAAVTEIPRGMFDGCENLASVTLPSVQIIGQRAFAGDAALNEFVLPSSVTQIGDLAFYDCAALTSVALPSTLDSVGKHAFYGCVGLNEVRIDSVDAFMQVEFATSTSNPLYYGRKLVDGSGEVTQISVNAAVLPYAFINCSSLKSVSFGEDATSIGEYAFAGNSSLSGFIFNEKASSTSEDAQQPRAIGAHAFENCVSLTDVTLPASLESVGENAFNGCFRLVHVRNLSAVRVSVDAYMYGEVVGKDAEFANELRNDNGLLLFTVNEKVYLLGYTGAQTELDLSDEQIDFIYPYAFVGTAVTSVVLPSKVERVGEYAFVDCNVQSVTFGEEVTEISYYAFGQSVQTIHFNGASTAWEDIDKDSEWDSEMSGDYQIVCTDTTIQKRQNA